MSNFWEIFILIAISVFFAVLYFISKNRVKICEANNLEEGLKKTSNQNFEKNSAIYNLWINSFAFPVWHRDIDGNIVNANRAFIDIIQNKTPYIPKYIKNKLEDVDFFSNSSKNISELGNRAKKLYEKSAKMHNMVQENIHIIVAGERKLYNITEIPMIDGSIGYAQDYSYVEILEKELLHNKNLQSDLIESMNSAIAIYDKEKNLQYYNSSFVKMWGLENAYLEKKPGFGELLDLLREKRQLPEKADFLLYKKEQLDLFTDLMEKIEENYYLPDGRTIRKLAIPHEHGGLLFLYDDISDIINLERSYKTLESVKQSTIENLNEGLLVFKPNGNLTLYNPAILNLLELNDDLLKFDINNDSGIHIKKFCDEINDLIENGSDYLYESITKSMNGRNSIWGKIHLKNDTALSWQIVPLPDGSVLLSFADITDSYKVEKSLKAEKQAYIEADKIKNNLLMNISYELRSPLTSIQGCADLLKRKELIGDLNQKQQDYINAIFTSSEQLNRLINDILEISTYESGRMIINKTKQNISEIIENIITNFKNNFEAEIITDIKKTHQNIQLEIDKDKIGHALFKLLENAYKLCSENPVIKISTVKSKDRFKIIIQDNGEGLAPEDIDSFFHPFKKITSDKLRGTGLNASIAKHIAELHDAEIKIETKNTENNIGTTAIFEFKIRTIV